MREFKTITKASLFVATLVALSDFCVPSVHANTLSIAPTLGTNSAYQLTPMQSLEQKNTITHYVYNETSKALEPKYYQVNLNNNVYGTGSTTEQYTFNFIDAEVLIDVKHDDVSAERFTNMSDIPISLTQDFIRQQAPEPVVNGDEVPTVVRGGAVYNSGTILNIESITADFIYNSVASPVSNAYGGAIDNSTAFIGDIVGDFVGNSVMSANSTSYGGAVHNHGTITSITGDFIGNSIHLSSSSAYGGAMHNSLSITNLTSNFISNSANSEILSRGGAISNNEGSIDTLIGDFIGNSAQATFDSSEATGGAIYNNMAVIKSINGDFIRNYVKAGEASGGAIHNRNNGIIADITGNFIENYVVSTSSSAKGGALYNSASKFGAVDDGTGTETFDTGFISSSFIGNYAKSEVGTAQGGAIWTDSDINVLADNKIVEFTGNYTESAGVRDENAIWVDSDSAVLSLNAKNDGVITFNDNIKGVNGYGLLLKGDSTGVINIHNTISDASLTVRDIGKVDFVDNQIREYRLNSMTSDADVDYALDINLTTKTVDTFITENESIGTITIDSLNVINGDWSSLLLDNDAVIQVLKVEEGTLQLALSQNINVPQELRKTITDVFSEDVTATVQWDEKYETITTTKDLVGTIGLGTKETTNDSIVVTVVREEIISEDRVSNGDTLQLWNQLETTEDKKFIFNSATDVYTATANLGATKGSKLNIEGVIAEDGTRSTVDFTTNSGFEVNDAVELNIQNVNLEDSSQLIRNSNSSGKINLINVNIKNNDNAIYSAGDVNIIAKDTEVELSGNSDDVIYMGSDTATLTFETIGTATISIEDSIKGINGYGLLLKGDSAGVINIHNTISDADLTVKDIGKVNFVDNQAREYNLSSMTSDADVDYALDINLMNKTVDKFIAKELSTGTITIDDLNVVDGNWESLLGKDDVIIQVLKVKDNSLQIAFSENINIPQEIKKTVINVASDEIVDVVLWNDTFETTSTTKEIFGMVGLGTTDTTNDSIVVGVLREQIVNVETTSNGDTLQLWNQYYSSSEKSFNFEATDNVYTVTANLGETKGAKLNVNGSLAQDGSRSKIDFANYSGFEINDAVELNIQNVNLEDSSQLIRNSSSSGKINLINVNIKNNTNAIYSAGDVSIIAKDAEVELSGNSGDVVYMGSDTATLTFETIGNAAVSIDDSINGSRGYNVNFVSDSGGDINLNNSILGNADVSLLGAKLNLGVDNYLDNNNLMLNSGTLSMANNHVGVSSLSSLQLYDTTDLLVDVDLATMSMDHFITDAYGFSPDAYLNVVGMNLLSDATQDTTRILFAQHSLKDHVKTTISEVAYSPIYKYVVTYDNSGEDGYFVFTRPSSEGSGSSGSAGFNPAVLGSSTGATVGALGTMNQTFNYGFQHSTDYMNIPYLERISMRDRNKYALAGGDLTEAGGFSPLYTPRGENSSVWVKPYATFESVDLKNGPKVSNISYGTLIGFDTELESINGGWDRVFTGYIGYNGASQRYLGTDTYQNGGLLGGTMTLYKGNFFNATTLSVGASVANNQTMYGNDNYTMLLGGIGNKAGYNFEFNEGKLILQPSMMMSYTFVNTFDYTNAAGVRIDNDPLHAIQLSPGLKVIGNLKDGWQPYASVNMVWNLMGKSDAAANGVRLPQMSIKPYVQYGVGVQKRFKHHFMAYGQAMMFNGGRNGICLSAGMRWDIGCKCHNKEKVETSPAVKKVVKAKNPNKISYLGE